MRSKARGHPSLASAIRAPSDVGGAGRGGPAGGGVIGSVDGSVDCTAASSPGVISDRGRRSLPLFFPGGTLTNRAACRLRTPSEAARTPTLDVKVGRKVATLDRTGIL